LAISVSITGHPSQGPARRIFADTLLVQVSQI
jgi:hypothetical protein